jgi:surface polysaccharide O-acyltransferase-like enzyme
VHLWFLSALLIGTLHVAILQTVGRGGPVIFYFVTLYIIGLTNGAYSAIPEIASLNLGVPGRLALPPLLIALGWSMSMRQVPISHSLAWMLFLGGTLLFISEAFYLHQSYRVPLIGHDFLLGTPLQAIGLLALAIARPERGAKTPLPAWGRYTLGVYAAHVAVMELVGARDPGNIAWETLKPLLVYALTLGLVVGLSRVPALRRFML